MSQNTNHQNSSFLHEFQIEGKGSGKLAIENWEEAMSFVNRITTNEGIAEYRKIDWEQQTPVKMATYCQDCQKIVPPAKKNFRKRPRSVCGVCGSKKIASGRESALKQFYRIEDSGKEEPPKI